MDLHFERVLGLVASLQRGATAGLSGQDARYWAQAVGDAASLIAQQLEELGLAVDIDDFVDVRLSACSITLPSAFVACACNANDPPPVQHGPGRSVSVEGHVVHELALGRAHDPDSRAPAQSTPVGSHAQLLIGAEAILNHPVGARYVAAAGQRVVRTTPPSAISRNIAFVDLLDLPEGIMVCEVPAQEESALHEASRFGLIPLQQRLPEYYSAFPPASVLASCNAVRRRLLARALDTSDLLTHFLRLYNVFEHAFLEAFARELDTAVLAGDIGRARELLAEKNSEAAHMGWVFQRIVAPQVAVGNLQVVNYPPNGDPLYTRVGLKPGFGVTLANWVNNLPVLIYRTRNAVVHTKADLAWLDPGAGGVAPTLQSCLLPDMLAIATLLVEG